MHVLTLASNIPIFGLMRNPITLVTDHNRPSLCKTLYLNNKIESIDT